ncbi:CpaD family pilus assembly protein [Erythrobacter sp. W53]|uniref:CpaD family pilus assembly protein n=1 Tax=Erythrobacteraceae TaxID=335929 RepID=UPI0036D2F89A
MKRNVASALVVSLGLTLTACGGSGSTLNRTLYSVNQPVVERSTMTLDLATNAGGMSVNEQQRLDGWFETMELGYGDRVSLDDPAKNPATRDVVAGLASRYGVLVADGSPVTEQFIQPGQARVIIIRSTASVPGCPDWSENSDLNFSNKTHSNYGCSTNANLAAMIANPEDLIEGQDGSDETTVTTSTKAIEAFRNQAPTGSGGLGGGGTAGGGN